MSNSRWTEITQSEWNNLFGSVPHLKVKLPAIYSIQDLFVLDDPVSITKGTYIICRKCLSRMWKTIGTKAEVESGTLGDPTLLDINAASLARIRNNFPISPTTMKEW